MKLLIIDTTVFLNSIQQLLHLSLTPSSSGVGYSSLVSASSILKSILTEETDRPLGNNKLYNILSKVLLKYDRFYLTKRKSGIH